MASLRSKTLRMEEAPEAMLHIVMDSAGDSPPDWLQTYAIEVIPVNIQFGEKTYLHGVDLTDEDFYQMVKTYHLIPKTSQPSPHQFIEYYRRIAAPGDTILSIHVTSQLSGTYESAVVAARDLEGELEVIPFDSLAGSAAMAFLCQEARLIDRAGGTLPEILARLNFIRDHITIILTLDTLQFARMSGRVKALQAALASILQIKPIIVLREGMLEMGERVRTRSRSLEQVIKLVHDRVGSQLINAAVVHAQDLDTAKVLLDKVRNAFNLQQVILTELSIAVAANLGPGTVGIVAYPLKEG
jgi:DegV family protein with EDD domain